MSAAKWSGVIDLLLSHQIVLSVSASRTMNLSLAERPVCLPVRDDQRAVLGEHALAAADRLLDQRGGPRFQ